MPSSGDLPGPDSKWRVFNHLSHQRRLHTHTHTHTHTYVSMFFKILFHLGCYRVLNIAL